MWHISPTVPKPSPINDVFTGHACRTCRTDNSKSGERHPGLAGNAPGLPFPFAVSSSAPRFAAGRRAPGPPRRRPLSSLFPTRRMPGNSRRPDPGHLPCPAGKTAELPGRGQIDDLALSRGRQHALHSSDIGQWNLTAPALVRSRSVTGDSCRIATSVGSSRPVPATSTELSEGIKFPSARKRDTPASHISCLTRRFMAERSKKMEAAGIRRVSS